MNDFLHGTEVNDVASKLVVISGVNASTVVLIGISPNGPAGLTLVNSPVDQAQFGQSVFDGRTIPHALDAHFAQGAGRLFVINCYKGNAHLTAIAAEATAVAANLQVPLAHVPVGDVVVHNTSEVPVLLVKDTDYTHVEGDKFITILTTRTYPATTALTVGYSYFDKAKVLAADIIGAIAGDGTRTGVQLLDIIYSDFGVTPKLIVAPVYIETQTVCDAILEKAETLRAHVFIDAPDAETQANAITSRGANGDYANFYTSNKRAIGIFSYIYKPDPLNPDTDGQPFPASPYIAAAYAAAINAQGIQRGPSNLPLAGFTKTRKKVSCGLNDKNSDANLLNGAGLMTFFTGYASGVRSWGNRNMAFPLSADISTFVPVQMTQDILDESVQAASLEFNDLPITQAWIDTVLSSVNLFINSLVKKNALIDGAATYDPNKNSPEDLQSGHITIDMSYLPPAPAERITFESYIDITLFSNLG